MIQMDATRPDNSAVAIGLRVNAAPQKTKLRFADADACRDFLADMKFGSAEELDFCAALSSYINKKSFGEVNQLERDVATAIFNGDNRGAIELISSALSVKGLETFPTNLMNEAMSASEPGLESEQAKEYLRTLKIGEPFRQFLDQLRQALDLVTVSGDTPQWLATIVYFSNAENSGQIAMQEAVLTLLQRLLEDPNIGEVLARVIGGVRQQAEVNIAIAAALQDLSPASGTAVDTAAAQVAEAEDLSSNAENIEKIKRIFAGVAEATSVAQVIEILSANESISFWNNGELFEVSAVIDLLMKIRRPADFSLSLAAGRALLYELPVVPLVGSERETLRSKILGLIRRPEVAAQSKEDFSGTIFADLIVNAKNGTLDSFVYTYRVNTDIHEVNLQSGEIIKVNPAEVSRAIQARVRNMIAKRIGNAHLISDADNTAISKLNGYPVEVTEWVETALDQIRNSNDLATEMNAQDYTIGNIYKHFYRMDKLASDFLLRDKGMHGADILDDLNSTVAALKSLSDETKSNNPLDLADSKTKQAILAALNAISKTSRDLAITVIDKLVNEKRVKKSRFAIGDLSPLGLQDMLRRETSA